MGQLARQNRAYKKIDQEAQMASQKAKQEFKIECHLLEAYYGRRFTGRFKISPDGIKPYLKLESAPLRRVLKARENQANFTEAHFKTKGFDVKLPKKPLIMYYLIVLLPNCLIGWFAKSQMMKQYKKITMRRKMIFFTYVGDQGGSLVPAVDVREMSPEEEKFFSKKL